MANGAIASELELAFRELETSVANDHEGYWTARGILEKLRPFILASASPSARERLEPAAIRLT